MANNAAKCKLNIFYTTIRVYSIAAACRRLAYFIEELDEPSIRYITVF